MNTTEKAYKEIMKVLNKYKSEIVFGVDSLETKAKNHLFGVELVEKYGFELDPKIINSTDWQTLKENVTIGFWDVERRKISWPDDGRQPNKETLLCISYPTGAYIFGSDHPTAFFQKFFTELKTYNPKYIDSANKSLYFSLDNASKIYNAYDSIIKRYYEEKQRNMEATEKAFKKETGKESRLCGEQYNNEYVKWLESKLKHGVSHHDITTDDNKSKKRYRCTDYNDCRCERMYGYVKEDCTSSEERKLPI